MNNIAFSPFSIMAFPSSGSLITGSELSLINFTRITSNFASASQMDVGSINLKYTSVDSGSSADLIFKVSSPENYNATSSQVFKISATGSNNEARIGIGKFDSDSIDSPLHIKGNTLVDGEFKLKSGAETISLAKDDLKNIIEGKPVADSTKNLAKSGITQTLSANAFVNLDDTNTYIKNNESGKIRLVADGLTLVTVDNDVKPSVTIGATGTKVMITGSTEISGSNTYVVSDLLTLLGNYGQTGSFAVSGSSTFTGDTNFDGVVNTTDLMNLLAGYNASGSNVISGSLVIDDRGAGGTALSITGSTTISGSSVYTVTDLLTLLGNYGQTGSFSVSGSSTFNGDTNFDGVVNSTDLMNLLAGYNASGSNVISGSLVIDDRGAGGTALSVTGSTNISGSSIYTTTDLLTLLGNFGQTGSFAVSGSSTFNGDTNFDGVVNTTDLLNVIAGFQASGSNAITGSLTMKTTGSMGSAIYFDVTGEAYAATLEVQIGDVEGVGNTTAIRIDDSNERITITGSLNVTGNQVDFTNLPTSDPGISGRLFQTASEAMGMTSGYQVVLISA